MKAFIEIQRGSADLVNVNFINVHTARTSAPGAIVLQVSQCDSDACGSFNYTNGVVSLTNNGIDYITDMTLSPFLFGKYMQKVVLKNLNFTHNLIVHAYSNPSILSTSALIYLENFYQFSVTSSHFLRNFVSGGAIVVNSDISLPKSTSPGQNTAYMYQQQHITFAKLSFDSNLGGNSILKVVFTKDVLNVVIQDLSFRSNAIEGDHIFSVENAVDATDALADGSFLTVDNPAPGQPSSIWIPPRSVSITGISITGTHSYSDLMFIQNCANVKIENGEFVDNGDSDVKALQKAYDGFAAVEGFVPAVVPKLPQPQSCTSLVSTQGVISMAWISVEVRNNQCTGGTCGLLSTHSSRVTAINKFSTKHNACKSFQGLAVHSPGYIQLAIDNMTSVNNTNPLGQMIWVGELSKITMINSLFQDNSGIYGTCIYLNFAQEATVRNATFQRNAAVESLGGAIYVWLGNANPVIFHLQDCLFEGNSAVRGGMLAIEATNETVIDFAITNSIFHNNSAELFGAAIYINLFIDFGLNSRIEGNMFTSHRSSYAVIYLMHKKGKLWIGNSNFEENSANIAAVLLIETNYAADTTLENVVFRGNYGAPTILKSNSRENSTFTTRRCSFTNNTHADVYMEGGVWQDFYGTFLGSSQSEFLFSAQAIAIALGSVIKSMHANDSGGVAHLMTSSYFSCVDCLFENNSAGYSGGVLFLEQSSAVSMRNCIFRNNSAIVGGSVAFMTSSQTIPSLIDSSLMEWNEGGNFGLIIAQSIIFMLNNITARNNSGNENAGLSLLIARLTITNSEFYNMKGITAAFISMFTTCKVVIRNTKFHDAESHDGGLIYISSSSELNISRSSFIRLKTNQGGVISAYSFSVIRLSEVIFDQVSTGATGSLLYLSELSLFIEKSIFTNFGNGGVYAYLLTSAEIRDSAFISSTGLMGAALYFYQSANVTLSGCLFSYLSAAQGGAVGFEALEERSLGQVTITDCHFDHCTANRGGAMYARNHRIQILRSEFEYNTASEAGAVFFDCNFLEMCSYAVIDSEFRNNSAKVKGGAISWENVKPLTTNSTFFNNSAQYGDDISSMAISIKIDSITPKLKTGRVLNESESLTTVTAVAPGQIINSVIVASLRDHYGQVLRIDGSSVGVVESSGAASISGVSKVTAENGQFVFDTFIVYARPGSNASVSISSTAISATHIGDPDPHEPSLALSFEIRDCVPGEARSDVSCAVCGKGTYSFTPEIPCQSCPANAECLGNITVYPDTGYWRSSLMSSIIRLCPNRDACLGGNHTSGILFLAGECATGYKGNLCQSCADHYSRTSKNKCGKCPASDVNLVRLVFIAILMVLVIILMVASTLRSATRPAATHSIMIRIFANYLQMVLIVTDFKLSWPEPVLNLFDAQESVGGATEQAYSIDCFLSERADSSTYYRKMQIIALLPVPLIIGAVAVWLVIAQRKKNITLLKRECIATIIILFFLLLPNLVKAMFSMFSCTEIESGEYWLTVDLDIKCFDTTHNLNILICALPAIIVWITAFPLICLGILIKFRARQDEMWMKLQYGFLINGFRRRCYYWEFLILYRKIIIICCAVFLNNSIPVQALTVQLLLLAAFFLQFSINPFITPVLNSMELWSILVADVTIYSGLYYMTEDISSSTSWFLFILIVTINVGFITYWISMLVGYFINILIQRYNKVGQILRPGHFVDKYTEDFIDTCKPVSAESASRFGITIKDSYKQMIGQNMTVNKALRYNPRAIAGPTSMST